MKAALVIIDIQNDYFPGGKNELVNSTEAGEKARSLLIDFRKKELPVIHIKHLSVRPGSTFFIPGTTGAEFHSSVQPLEAEKIFIKHYPNSFKETGLHEYLKQQQIDTLVLAGMMSHMCVDATARASKDLGYQVRIAEDACATKNLAFRGKIISAQQVHGSFMSALSYFYADVTTCAELIEQS